MERTQRTVTHPNGLVFRVIPANSYTARMSRDRRQLVMTDGQLWNVGAPIGWYGVPAAWRTTEADRGTTVVDRLRDTREKFRAMDRQTAETDARVDELLRTWAETDNPETGRG